MFERKEKNYDALRSELKEATDKCLIPGAVVVIAEKGETVLAEAFGERQIYPHREEMTLDTLFDLASLTKVVSVLPVVLDLVRKGELEIDTGIRKFFDTYEESPANEITVRQLLTHTSGLQARSFLKQYGGEKRDMIYGILQSPLSYEPGSKVNYSNRGYILLGEIVEKVSGKSLADYAKEHIWTPAGMHDTTFNPSEKRINGNVAATECNSELDSCIKGIAHDENTRLLGGVAGHAGVFSTAGDLAKFCSMILSNGHINGKQVLDKSLLRLSMENHTAHLNEPRGMGWDIFSHDRRKGGVFGHLGFTGTALWIDSVQDRYCILLTNRVHPSRENTNIRSIRKSVYEQVFT